MHFHAFTMCFPASFCSRKLSIVTTFSSCVEVLFSVSDVSVDVFVVCNAVGVLPLLQAIDNVLMYTVVNFLMSTCRLLITQKLLNFRKVLFFYNVEL